MNPNEAPESIEQTDSIRCESISFETALAIVKRADIDSRIKAIREIVLALYSELRPLNPHESEHGKYLNLEATAHGYGTASFEFSVYFAEGLRIGNAKTFSDIEKTLRENSPEHIKARRIAELQAELAKLTSETKNEGAD